MLNQLSRTEIIEVLATITIEHGGRSAKLSYLGQARREDLQRVAIRLFDNDLDATRIDEVVPAGCPARLSWISTTGDTDAWTDILSTQHGDAGFAPLSVDALRFELKGVRALSIASAYYDVGFFRALLLADGKPSETLDEIRIVLNGLSGSRLAQQVRELEEIQNELQSVYTKAEVRLAFARSIFHPKIFLLRRRDSRAALVGSANATTAAMTENEEILLRIRDGIEGLEAYFAHIWEVKAERLGSRCPQVRSLLNFLRTGRLFFKTSTTFQMSFNPFGELLRLLPRSERSLLTNVRLRNSEPKPGVGPFDLVATLGMADDEEDQAARSEDEKHRASIKPFSVETCFGYWVPDAMVALLKSELDLAGRGKRRRFERIAMALTDTSDSVILRAYGEYVEDAHRLLMSLPSTQALLGNLRSDPFQTREWFAERLTNLRNNLARSGYVERLCRPFTDAPVPELWDDPVSREQFETTFFEYLAYVSNAPTQSRVPSRILEVARCDFPTDASTIRERLVSFLKESGWSDRDHWKLPPEQLANA
ncbi:MAG: phospholipase D family protein [Deltaproteobacteria bacterium]|nr:phospholipase D family protein [Deltaproteobacteria bacterium]